MVFQCTAYGSEVSKNYCLFLCGPAHPPMFQYSADRSSCHKSLVPGFHRAYCPSFSSCIFIFLQWLFLNSKHFFFFFSLRSPCPSHLHKKNLLKSGSKNMSACKVAPFVHFEHFIFLLYSLVPGGVASCSARSVIAYSGGIIGLFALLVHLPTHLLVYIIAVYSVLGQAGTGSLVLPSLIISR